jgi:hypothetical protein
LNEKFRELAGTVLHRAGVAAVADAVAGCEKWPDVGALTELLRRHGRA